MVDVQCESYQALEISVEMSQDCSLTLGCTTALSTYQSYLSSLVTSAMRLSLIHESPLNEVSHRLLLG